MCVQEQQEMGVTACMSKTVQHLLGDMAPSEGRLTLLIYRGCVAEMGAVQSVLTRSNCIFEIFINGED